MVLGIFGKKSDHPLADIKVAQQLLDDMPKTDSLKSLQEFSDWVEAIHENANEFRLDHQWAVLRMFDQAAQPHLRKLLHEYFSPQPLSKFQENRLWSLLDTYYTQSDLCHQDVLNRFNEGAKGSSNVRNELPLLCARGISAITGRLKMIAAHYGMIDQSAWKNLANYFNTAESQGFQFDPVALYPALNSSVAQEFAVLVTWSGSGAGTMSPLQEHISERLLAFLGKGLQISRSYNALALFVFDTAQPTPPMRASAEATIYPALRFIDAEALRPQLDGLIRTLDKGIVPDSLNLYSVKYEAELLRDIAKRVLQSINLPLPTRRNPRRKINVNLRIATGFYKMLEQTDVGLNFNSEDSDSWDVEDISATGFRSVVKLTQVDGIKIGSLIGSKPQSVSHWGAGVVRRLRRDGEGKLHIGVEVLSPRIVGVQLVDRSLTGSDSYQIGIYLNRATDTSGEVWLLMKPETFSIGRSLTMHLDEKDFLLLPLSLVERGDDYDLARYRKMEQDGGIED